MKHITAVFAVVLLFGPHLTLAGEYPQFYKCSRSGINAYAGPSVVQPIIGYSIEGKTYRAVEKQGRWLRVEVGQDIECWFYEYLTGENAGGGENLTGPVSTNGLSALLQPYDGVSREIQSPNPNPNIVTYKVTGTARSVDVTFTNKGGGTSQYSDVRVPWSYDFSGIPEQHLYISAQNNDTRGTVTVTIYRGDIVLQTSTSRGEYVIASANARF